MLRDGDVQFLLDLVISRVVSGAVSADPTAFILHYRLGEQEAEQIMNEVGSIATEVEHGNQVTSMDAVRRICAIHQPLASSPELFAADAVRAWAPATWEKIKNS